MKCFVSSLLLLLPFVTQAKDDVDYWSERYPAFSLAVYDRTFPCMKPTILMPLITSEE